MSTPLPPADQNIPAVVPPVEPAVVPPVEDTTDWKTEAEKWKTLSRKHENAEKTLKDQIKSITNASMSEAEKALADAKEEGRTEALNSSRDAFVTAEFRVQAAKSGVELPDDFADLLNLAKFTDSKGKPDESAIAKFVGTLGAGNKKFADPADLGIGSRNRAPGGIEQLTRAHLKDMTPAAIVEARKAGHLNDLLGITT